MDHGTYETERLLILNSYAVSVGYRQDQVPYKVTAPSTGNDDIKEFMGFAYRLPNDMHEVSNPVEAADEVLEANDDEENQDQDGSEEIRDTADGDPLLANFLEDIFVKN